MSAAVVRRRGALLCLVAFLCSAVDLLPIFTAFAATIDGSHELRIARTTHGVMIRLCHAQVADTTPRHGSIDERSACGISAEPRQEQDHKVDFLSAFACEEPNERECLSCERNSDGAHSCALRACWQSACQFSLSLYHAATCFAEHTNAPLQPQSAFLMSRSVSLLI
jgi:hypothetical protein